MIQTSKPSGPAASALISLGSSSRTHHVTPCCTATALHQLWFHLPSSKFHLILPLCFCCSISCHEKNILETRYATIISHFLCSTCLHQKPHIGISLLGFWDKIACNGFLTCRRSISSSTSRVSPCQGLQYYVFFSSWRFKKETTSHLNISCL